MKKFILSNTLLIIVLSTFSQWDQKNFENTFNQEINESEGENYSKRENHSALYQYVPPQQVPEWFIQPKVSDKNEVFAIGISDPGLDSIESMQQAIYRAEIMANVLRKSTTQLLCDFFLNEVDKSTEIVYEHFTRITSIIPCASEYYTVVDSFRNAFDETLVLIKYAAPTTVETSQVDEINLELYRNETEISKTGEFESIYELQVKPINDSVPELQFYQLTEFGSRYDVLSGAKGEVTPIPIYSLGYKGIPALDSVDQCYFSHGLWKEYLKSVMTQIIENARVKPENIKFLGDDYNKVSYQKLTRGISVNKQRFVITEIKAKENKLLVNLQELPIEE
ncbi:MAG: hypothetical protein WCX31_05675 [Salinivirgaceae bacterium]|jgi:hypothetical protein